MNFGWGSYFGWTAAILLLWRFIWLYGNPDAYEKDLYNDMPWLKKVFPPIIIAFGYWMFKMNYSH